MTSWSSEHYRYHNKPYARGEGSSSFQSSLGPPLPPSSPTEDIDINDGGKVLSRSVWFPFTMDPELTNGMAYFKVRDRRPCLA